MKNTPQTLACQIDAIVHFAACPRPGSLSQSSALWRENFILQKNGLKPKSRSEPVIQAPKGCSANDRQF